MRTAIGDCEVVDQIHKVEGVESLRVARRVPSALNSISAIPVTDSLLPSRDDCEGSDEGWLARV